MKQQMTVYLEQALMGALQDYAARSGKPKSLVVEAALSSFLSPDAAERQEAALARRLDRLFRSMDRLERDVGIGIEALGLYVRFWLAANPVMPEQTDATRAKTQERYGAYVEALGRRLERGARLTREVSYEVDAKGNGQQAL